jgi:transposase-like protein
MFTPDQTESIMKDDPYSSVRDEEPSSNLMSVLSQLADELIEADQRIQRLEKELSEAKEFRKEIAESRIPDATDGMEGKISLQDGRTLEIKEEIRASIAGERKEPAISWLDENGSGHIVKRKISFELPRGDVDSVRDLIEAVQNSGAQVVSMKNEHSVHHMTLLSWVKERLAEGDDLPREIFGIYRQRTAKVKS